MNFVSLLAATFIRSLHAMLRVKHARVENIDNTKQYILAFWHDHLLVMIHSRYRLPTVVMISQSKDGEYISQVVCRYGVETARGSSTRGGGAAFREVLRHARAGKNIAITPDGPKGPRRVLKGGVISVAQASGLPIVPVAFAAKKKSSSARGTAWSSPFRSRRPCSCTDLPSRCLATATSRNGA